MSRRKKVIKNRNDFVHTDIQIWLLRNGITYNDVADQLKKHPSTVANCCRGLINTPEIQNHISQMMGYSPWEKFPEQPYIPPEETRKVV